MTNHTDIRSVIVHHPQRQFSEHQSMVQPSLPEDRMIILKSLFEAAGTCQPGENPCHQLGMKLSAWNLVV